MIYLLRKKSAPMVSGPGRPVTFEPEVETSLTRARAARKAAVLLVMPAMLAAVFFVMLLHECGRTVV